VSLVNDMLRDLEQRNERPATVPGNQKTVKAAQFVEVDPPSVWPRYALWGIGLIAVLTTAWLFWQQYSESSASTATIGSLKQQPATTEPKLKQVQQPELQAEPLVEATPMVPVVEESISEDTASPSALLPTKKPAQPSIELIQWAGTDQGGDLVVRLKGSADVQVLSQSDKVIVIAFDGVVLQTALPVINNPLIKRVDVNVADQRAVLTVTTRLLSQFAFRVQQEPTTLILGVLPKEPRPTAVVAAPKPSKVELAEVVTESSSQTGGSKAIKATTELPAEAEPRQVQPVTKSVSKLSEKQQVERAKRLINKGRMAEAETLLQSTIKQQPQDSVAARRLLATLYLSSANSAKADALLKQSLALSPKDVPLRKLQARSWIAAGQQAKAIELLQSAKPAIAKDSEFYELLAGAYQQNANYPEAAQHYYQLLQSNNSVPRWWIGLGYSLEQSQRYADARNAYSSAIQIPSIDSSLKHYAKQRIQALSGR